MLCAARLLVTLFLHICVYMCVYIHTYMNIHLLYIYIHMYICTYFLAGGVVDVLRWCSVPRGWWWHHPYIYVRKCISVHKCIYVYIPPHICICMYVYIGISMHEFPSYWYVYMLIHICVPKSVVRLMFFDERLLVTLFVLIFVYTYMCIYVYMYIHVYLPYIYIYMYTYIFPLRSIVRAILFDERMLVTWFVLKCAYTCVYIHTYTYPCRVYENTNTFTCAEKRYLIDALRREGASDIIYMYMKPIYMYMKPIYMYMKSIGERMLVIVSFDFEIWAGYANTCICVHTCT